MPHSTRSVFSLLCLILISTRAHAAPVHYWSQRFGDSSDQFAQSVATDADGNVIVGGSFRGTVDFGGGPLTSAGNQDIFLAKFDPSGAHLWSKTFGVTSAQTLSGIAVDESGNVILLAWFSVGVDFGGGLLTSVGGSDVALAKFAPDGSHLWSQSFGDASAQFSSGVATDAAGNIAITGNFLGTVDFGGGLLTSAGGHAYIAVFDASGSHVWSRNFGDILGDQYGISVAIDGSGNVVSTGYFIGTIDFGGGLLLSPLDSGIYVAKFDASGAHVWSASYGDAGEQIPTSIAVDGAGDVVVTGQFDGSVDFGGGMLNGAGDSDIFLAKFDAAGAHMWSKGFGDEYRQTTQSVAVDAGGNVVITGALQGTANFGGGPVTSAGFFDVVVAMFDPNGGHVWSGRYGDLGQSQTGASVVIDNASRVVLAGYFQGTIDFGGGPMTSTDGSYDVFVAQFHEPPTPVLRATPLAAALGRNYPNPFNPATSIPFTLASASHVQLRIVDVNGHAVATLMDGWEVAGAHVARWDGRDATGASVPSGVYFARMEWNGAVDSRRLVLLK